MFDGVRNPWKSPITSIFPSVFSQMYQIPTMQNGPDLAKRFYKELTDIQVRASPHLYPKSKY